MSQYYYKALNNKTKEIISGTVEAESPRNARDKVRAMGYIPTIVNESENTLFETNTNLPKIGNMSLSERIHFLNEFRSMIKSGISAIEALNVIGDSIKQDNTSKLCHNLIYYIKNGETLSQAMQRYENIFGNVCIALITTGEATGTLPTTISRIIEIYNNENNLKRRVKDMSIYPILTVVLAIGVLFLFGKFVFPKLIYGLDINIDKIPRSAQNLMDFTNFVCQFWYIIIPIFIGAIQFLILIWENSNIKKIFDYIVLQIPVIKDFVCYINLATFFAILKVSYEAGLTIPATLELAEISISNTTIKKGMHEIKNIITAQGISLSEALKSIPIIPQPFIVMIQTGENSGELSKMFEDITIEIDNKINDIMSRLVKLYQPAITIILGTIVALLGSTIMNMYYSALFNGI